MTPGEATAFGAAAWDGPEGGRTADSQLVLDLYDREQISLRRYLAYLGVDAETAAEAVQESFLRLYQHLLAGGDRGHLRAWLYRVAHNLARNSQTAFRASRESALEDAEGARAAVDPASSAEDRLLVQESERRIQAALMHLSPAERNCLVLRSQGLKYREIAAALELSVSTIAENVQRGLDKLKDLI